MKVSRNKRKGGLSRNQTKLLLNSSAVSSKSNSISSYYNKRDDKLIFSYIVKKDCQGLARHLEGLFGNQSEYNGGVGQTGATQQSIDITQVYDKKGLSPLIFACWYDQFECVQVLCNHVILYGSGSKA